MKKLLGLLAVAPMAITACGGVEASDTRPRIYLLAGPTGLGASNISTEDYNMTVREGFAASKADILKCDFEMAAIPVDQAWELYNETEVKDNCGLQIASVVATNMLQFMTEKDSTAIAVIADLDGKELWAPNSPTVTAIIQEMIDKKTNWTSKPIIVSKNDTNEISAELLKGTNDDLVAVIPEPLVSALEISQQFVRGEKVLDMDSSLVDRPIAAFVMNKEWADANEAVVTDVMKQYSDSVDFMVDSTNLDAAAKKATDLKVTPSEPVAKKAIPMSSMSWTVEKEMTDDVTDLLVNLLNKDSQAVADAANFWYLAPTIGTDE